VLQKASTWPLTLFVFVGHDVKVQAGNGKASRSG
jgi:hypothetical protein